MDFDLVHNQQDRTQKCGTNVAQNMKTDDACCDDQSTTIGILLSMDSCHSKNSDADDDRRFVVIVFSAFRFFTTEMDTVVDTFIVDSFLYCQFINALNTSMNRSP